MGEWKVGLFGCFGNMGLCLASFCVPIIVVGKAAEQVDENGALWAIATGIQPLSALYLRYKIREKSGIEGGCIKDCLITCCCFCCATYQMAEEVSAFDKYIEQPSPQEIQRMVE